MFSPGGWEMVIIFLLVLLVFGAKRIPEIAAGLGKGITEFKRALNSATVEGTAANSATTDGSSDDSQEEQILPPSEK